MSVLGCHVAASSDERFQPPAGPRVCDTALNQGVNLMKKCCTLCFAMLLPVSVLAAEPPAAAIAALQTVYPSAKVTWSVGDLNRDGVSDAAGLADTDGMQKIVALLADIGGTYSVFSSNEFPSHSRRFDLVTIEVGLLVYHFDASGGCCSHSATDFKLKFRDGGFYFIGLESKDVGTIVKDGTDEWIEYSSGVSANYITHKAIYWRASESRRVEVSRPIKDHRPIRLQEFFTAEWGTPDEKLDGYINERFEFVSTP